MNFFKKNFSPILLTITLILLIYIIYKSEFYFFGSKREYYLKYYIISSLLVVFSIITFLINQKIKEYIIISFISLVMCLYLIESYLTIKESIYVDEFLKVKISNENKERVILGKLYKNNINFDKRTKLKIYEDLKENNNSIVMVVSGTNHSKKNYSILPLSGISNRETIHCNENGYYAIYQSDRYGFNNPDKEWDNEDIEYLLIGDSYTHGACVNRPNDIGSVLRTLSNKSVLNLGYSGNGPYFNYATMREYFNSNMRKVLWIHYEGNDLGDLKNNKNNKYLTKYIEDLNFSQNLKLKQKNINVINFNAINEAMKRDAIQERENKLRKLKKSETLISKCIKFFKIYNTRITIFPDSFLPEFKKIIKLAKDYTDQNNSKLYFVYLPESSRFNKNYDNTNYNSIKNIMIKLNIPFIDIYKEVFIKEQNPQNLFSLQIDGHYTVEGYRKVTETIYKFTKN